MTSLALEKHVFKVLRARTTADMSDKGDAATGGATSPAPGHVSPLININPNPPQTSPDPARGAPPPYTQANSPTNSPKQGDNQPGFRFGAGSATDPGPTRFAPARDLLTPSAPRQDQTPAMKARKFGASEEEKKSASPDLKSFEPRLASSLHKRRTLEGQDPVVEAVTTRQLLLQQDCLLTLISFIKDDPSRIFNSTRVVATEYQVFSDNRAQDLYRFFYDLYKVAFQHFDSRTQEILTTYLTYCSRVFDEVAHVDDKQNFSTQARFLAIAICFGIDRALTGLKHKDSLFRDFSHNAADEFHTLVYDKNELVLKVPELPYARDLYSDFFRKDSFHPLDKGSVPVLGSMGVSYTDITHHGFTTPVNYQRTPQIAPFFKQNSPEQQHFKYPGTSQTQQSPRSPYNQPDQCSTEKTHQEEYHQPPPGKSTAYGRGDDNYSDSDLDRCLNDFLTITPSHEQRQRPTGHDQPSRGPSDYHPRPGSKQRFSNKVETRIYTPDTEDDSYDDSDSNYSDPLSPKTPVHQKSSTGATGAYFGHRLSTAGRVYDINNSRIRKSTRKSSFINNIKQDINNFKLDDTQRASVLGTSLGIAHSINAFTKEGQRQQRDSFKFIPAPPEDLDLRVDSFDYDREGRTAEDILGRRFSKLRFPSEAVRLSTLRSIFSRVVDDPASSNVARHIALNQLGQFDHPKLTKQEVEHYVSRSISRLDTHTDPEIIPPPILGNNSFDGRTFKTLQTRIGMTERFSFDELSPALLRNILTNLSAVITNDGLREDEAYALLRRLTNGVTYETSQLAEFEHKTPFNEYWLSIQKTQKRTSSAREHEKKLKQMLTSDRVDNLEKTLNEIMVSTFKIHEKELDPNYRKLITQRDCLKNFRTFIRRHYAPYFSQINTCFMDRLRQAALEKDDPTFTNENTFHHQKIQIFLEIACSILSQYEPEEIPSHQHRSISRQNTYIHAMDAGQQETISFPDQKRLSKDQPQQQVAQNQMQQQSAPQQHQQRAPSRFNNQRASTPGPGFQQRQTQSYGNQPSRPQSRAQSRQRPTYTCFLCNIQGHSYRDCKKYRGQQPSNQHCNQCGGSHKGECRSRRQAQTPGPTAQIAAFDSQQPTQQPYMDPQQQQQRNYQPRSNTPYQNNQGQGYQRTYQNDYRPQSRNFPQQGQQWNNDRRSDYRQNDRQGRPPYRNNDQQQYQNNQGYFRSQSRNNGQYQNYPRNDGQNFNGGQQQYRSKSRSDYQYNDRRSQSGYRNDRNPNQRYNNGYRNNGNSSNFTPLGQRPRFDDRQPRNNGYDSRPPRQYDQKQHDPDHGRTTPFFKPTYYNSQGPQQPKEQTPPIMNGIGNTGFQQVPITARLNAMAAEDNSSYSQPNSGNQ